MTHIRPAAVAGTFYPSAPKILQQQVDDLLKHAKAQPYHPKALIAPHAGFIYSGPIAASAYACLTPYAHQISRVILIGPSHHVAIRGLALPTVSEFQSPLGTVTLDSDAVATLLELPQVHAVDQAHEWEHSLEVHLPFLQSVLTDFSIVPLVVGDATTSEITEVLDRVWGSDETLIVISSDLSHYLTYTEAQSLDGLTSKAIAALQPEKINNHMACGRKPIMGLLEMARRKGLHCEVLDVRNSGDTAGSKDRVVGYGAYAFH